VEHFIDLASGNKEWTDPKTKSKQKRPFYNGLLVHRIIPTYLLQTGCPLNNGRGDPGFVIPDEFHPTLKHQEAGIVSMANAGPNTNGSQFFITLRATPWLDVKTVSGKFCSNFELPTRCQTDQHCQRYAEMFAEASSGTPKCENRSFQQGHTIFGKVAYGLPIINRIAEQPLDGNDQPLSPIRIDTITIQRAPQWQRSWLNIK
jgi:cyclophilin family peptidyl-prolyl cis-trans isomerase